MGFGNILGPISLQQKSLAALPSAVGLRTGIVYEISDYGGNIATVVNGVWRFEYPFRTTWAGRPAVDLVPVGTELQVTDYTNQKFISDGTYWRPAQGRVAISQRWGKVAYPLATLNNTSQGVFTIPGGNPLIRAGMIIPHSRVYLEALTRKEGAGGTAGFYSRLSLVGASFPDATFATATIANSNLQCNRFFGSANFGTSKTQFVTSQFLAPGAAVTNSTVDKAAQINTDADMEVSMSISAATVTDSFSLFGYSVWLEA